METSLWQKFWRWIVGMEFVIGITGVLLLVWLSAAFPLSLGTLKTPPEQLLAAGYLGMASGAVALIAVTLMLFTVPVWIVVELHGWRRNRRDRAQWNSLGSVDPEWQQGRNSARR